VRTALAVLALAVAAPAAVGAQELAWSGTIQYAEGAYIFTEPTRTLSLYSGLSLTWGRARLTGGVPLILQNSGAVTLVGGTYLPTGGEGHQAVGGRQGHSSVPMGGGRRGSSSLAGTGSLVDATAAADSVAPGSGSYALRVGDPFFQAGMELYRGFGVLRSVELTASVKAPVSDLDSGVGTGEWDYAAGGAVALGVGRVLGFVDLSYWWYGDLPELELRDGLGWGAGIGIPLSRALRASALATGSNRVIATADAASTASVALGYLTRSGTLLSLAVGTGLTETAPDLTLSVGWHRTLLGR
jgi:hypothetical protein